MCTNDCFSYFLRNGKSLNKNPFIYCGTSFSSLVFIRNGLRCVSFRFVRCGGTGCLQRLPSFLSNSTYGRHISDINEADVYLKIYYSFCKPNNWITKPLLEKRITPAVKEFSTHSKESKYLHNE